MKLEDIKKEGCYVSCQSENERDAVIGILENSGAITYVRPKSISKEPFVYVWRHRNLNDIMYFTADKYDPFLPAASIAASDFITSNTPATLPAPNEHGDDDFAIPEHIKLNA